MPDDTAKEDAFATADSVMDAVMTVDGEVHAKMDPERAIELLESIRKEEVRA